MRQHILIQKPLYFAPLVPEVLNDKRLSPFDRMLLSIIINLAKQGDYCYARNNYFAKNLRCSIGAVSKSINKMHKIGYIVDNIPDPHDGGRRYLRSVRDDIIHGGDVKNE